MAVFGGAGSDSRHASRRSSESTAVRRERRTSFQSRTRTGETHPLGADDPTADGEEETSPSLETRAPAPAAAARDAMGWLRRALPRAAPVAEVDTCARPGARAARAAPDASGEAASAAGGASWQFRSKSATRWACFVMLCVGLSGAISATAVVVMTLGVPPRDDFVTAKPRGFGSVESLSM